MQRYSRDRTFQTWDNQPLPDPPFLLGTRNAYDDHLLFDRYDTHSASQLRLCHGVDAHHRVLVQAILPLPRAPPGCGLLLRLSPTRLFSGPLFQIFPRLVFGCINADFLRSTHFFSASKLCQAPHCVICTCRCTLDPSRFFSFLRRFAVNSEPGLINSAQFRRIRSRPILELEAAAE